MAKKVRILSAAGPLSIPWNDGTDDVVTVVPSQDVFNKSVSLSYTDNLTSYTRTMHITFDLTSPPSGFTPSVLTFTQEGIVIDGTSSTQYVDISGAAGSTHDIEFKVHFSNFAAHVDTLSASVYNLGTSAVSQAPALAGSDFWLSAGAISHEADGTVTVVLTLNQATVSTGVVHYARVALQYGKAVGFYGIQASF